MKLSKVQKSAMMLAVAVAMMGQVAQAATNTKAGGPTSTQKSQATQGAAAQSAKQAGQAQDGSAQGAAKRARTGSFKPAGQVQVQTKTAKTSRTSLAPESTELSALKGANMNLDNQALSRVEKEMQTPATNVATLEAQAAMDPNGPAAKQLEAIKDNQDFDTLVTSGVKKSGSWSAEVKGNLDFVLQRAGVYLNGTERIIGADGNPIANPTRGQALRQAAKDLEAHTASKGADKKVVLNIRDISKWCK